MKKYQNKRLDDSGYSFLEVMIALTIVGVVTTSIFSLYIRQHKNYMIQEDITDIQQNARASIDELGRHIRMAGNDLPYSLDAIVASNTNPDTITLTYRAENCDTYLSAAMPQPSAELKCATDVSCFYDGQWVYIFEPDSGGGEWFEISHVQPGSKHIQHNTMTLSKTYGADAILLALTEVKFFIDQNTNPDHPALMILRPGQAAQVYAENVEDLQFLYRMKNGAVVDEPVMVDAVREVMVTVRAMSNNPDADGVYGASQNQDDDRRRRTYNTSVHVRNLAG
ncbi:MAG: prepilin-type N-terminal cleavage/methylation domain-containing protein [bacterium]|nr:prepilin-type N-terminal cleavage/methylation domain-containing protein [bacterium]